MIHTVLVTVLLSQSGLVLDPQTINLKDGVLTYTRRTSMGRRMHQVVYHCPSWVEPRNVIAAAGGSHLLALAIPKEIHKPDHEIVVIDVNAYPLRPVPVTTGNIRDISWESSGNLRVIRDDESKWITESCALATDHTAKLVESRPFQEEHSSYFSAAKRLEKIALHLGKTPYPAPEQSGLGFLGAFRGRTSGAVLPDSDVFLIQSNEDRLRYELFRSGKALAEVDLNGRARLVLATRILTVDQVAFLVESMDGETQVVFWAQRDGFIFTIPDNILVRGYEEKPLQDRN